MIVLYARKGVSRLRAAWGQVRQAAKSRASVVYRVVLDVPMLTVNLEGTRHGLQGGRSGLRTTTPGGTLGASREPRAPRPEALAQTHRGPEIDSPGGPAGGSLDRAICVSPPLLSNRRLTHMPRETGSLLPTIARTPPSPCGLACASHGRRRDSICALGVWPCEQHRSVSHTCKPRGRQSRALTYRPVWRPRLSSSSGLASPVHLGLCSMVTQHRPPWSLFKLTP